MDITYPDLSGRVALVTGGSRALGAQTCRTLAGSGVHVAVGGRDEAAVAEVVRQIQNGGGTAMAELAPEHVRVNCVAPSSVVNERMSAHMSAEQLERLGAQFPLGRLGRPADVAGATAFLASDTASWITGVTLDLTAGRYIG